MFLHSHTRLCTRLRARIGTCANVCVQVMACIFQAILLSLRLISCRHDACTSSHTHVRKQVTTRMYLNRVDTNACSRAHAHTQMNAHKLTRTFHVHVWSHVGITDVCTQSLCDTHADTEKERNGGIGQRRACARSHVHSRAYTSMNTTQTRRTIRSDKAFPNRSTSRHSSPSQQ